MTTTDKPILYMLIGVPYSGKSTYTRSLHHCHVLSTDNYIEKMAQRTKMNYNDCFRIYYREAEFDLYSHLKEYVSAKQDVVWDQTNVSKKSRAKKLAKFPGYHKIAVFFPTPSDEEMKRRIAFRKDKVIPEYALQQMKKQLEEPSYDEGFDEIIIHHDVSSV